MNFPRAVNLLNTELTFAKEQIKYFEYNLKTVYDAPLRLAEWKKAVEEIENEINHLSNPSSDSITQ